MGLVAALRAGAAGLLALSLAAVTWALWSTDRASRIQGPAALATSTAGELWVGVGDRLWRLSTTGSLLRDDALQALGLPGPPQAMARHPDGRIVVSVRNDPTLYLLDPADARVTQRIQPRWPEDLAAHGGRAINLALHPDGRIAIATGGGHAVALFDATGRWLARTASNAYRFTNGLWWDGDALWTTDTNRTVLQRLDGRTLALQQMRTLDAGPRERYLGPARAHPDDAARVALIRFANGMTEGRVTILRGRPPAEDPLVPGRGFEPVDVDWLGNAVIFSDDRSMDLWRIDEATSAAVPFGDATVRARLAGVEGERRRLRQAWASGLAGAIASFGAGVALLTWAQTLKRRSAAAARPIDLSRLGTPRLQAWPRIRLVLRLNSPFVLLLGAALLLRAVIGSGLVTIALMVVLPVAASPWIYRRWKRLAGLPEMEPAVNAAAVARVERGDMLRERLQPGEPVLETWTWMRPTLHWAVLTDRRLLVFVAGLIDHRLQHDIARSEVRQASAVRPPQRWMARLQGFGWLDLELADGTRWQGSVPAPTVAERVAAQLGVPTAQVQAGSAATAGPTHGAVAEARPRPPARRWAVVLASFLVPGTGQWMQNRARTALVFFLPWVVLVTFAAWPVFWAASGPRAEVSPRVIVNVLVALLAIGLISAFDTWRMEGLRHARRDPRQIDMR